jgi:serine/threonine protein phosphatase PrpC
LSPSDKFLIIGCDGIWEKLSNEQICDFIDQRLEKGLSLEETGCQFLEENLAQDTSCTIFSILEGVGCDNMTAVIV